MNQFILQTLRKYEKLTREQAREVFAGTVEEIDRLETVLDSINLGILVCDASHKLLLTNKYVDRLLDIKDYEHGCEPVWGLVYDDVIASFLCTTLNGGDRIEGYEFVTETRRKERILLNMSILPLVKLYRVTGSLIILEDVTKKRSREANMRRVESLASLTTLAAGVAHEIKNPLASLAIHVQLVRKMLEQNRQKCLAKQADDTSIDTNCYQKLISHLSVADEEIDRLNRIVVDFLFAVRPLDLIMLRSDINTLLKGLINFLTVEFQEHDIQCVPELADSLPLIDFDERMLKEAFFNLIKNAIEAMKNGGSLTIRTELADSDVVISIIDTGEGMSEETQTKIFEPYFTTKAAGTGLGLTQVFKIIREHNGEIFVHSHLGEGSVFSVNLPVPQTGQRLLRFDSGEMPQQQENY